MLVDEAAQMEQHGETRDFEVGSTTRLGDAGDGEPLSDAEQKNKNSEPGILEGGFSSWVESGARSLEAGREFRVTVTVKTGGDEGLKQGTSQAAYGLLTPRYPALLGL